jgi:hypothetical protein
MGASAGAGDQGRGRTAEACAGALAVSGKSKRTDCPRRVLAALWYQVPEGSGRYNVPPLLYSLAFGGILPLVSLMVARILANTVDKEDRPESLAYPSEERLSQDRDLLLL